MVDRRTFRVWKTICLGQYPNYQGYKACIARAGGIRIADTADEILRTMRCAKEKTEVDLVSIYPGRDGFNGDLGFRQPVSRSQIYEHVLALGLELCSIEIAPALRLAYQLRGGPILIGMTPVNAGQPRTQKVLTLYNDAGPSLWLNYEHFNPPDRPVSLATEWVFVQPRREP